MGICRHGDQMSHSESLLGLQRPYGQTRPIRPPIHTVVASESRCSLLQAKPSKASLARTPALMAFHFLGQGA